MFWNLAGWAGSGSRRVGSQCFAISRVGPGQDRIRSDQDFLLFRGSDRVRIASGRIRIFSNLAGRAGSGPRRVGSGWFQISQVGLGRVGSGRVGSGRVGSGLVGSGSGRGRVGSGRVRSGPVGSGRVGSDRIGVGFDAVGSGWFGSDRVVLCRVLSYPRVVQCLVHGWLHGVVLVSCLVWSCLVWSCLVWSCLVLSCLPCSP